jgi:hypothetical protein
VGRAALLLEILEDGLDLIAHLGVCVNAVLEVFEDLGVDEPIVRWGGHGG